jgi:Flp pilus assembly protein TadD
VLYHLGVAHFESGNLTEAVNILKKAIAISPEDKRSEKMLKRILDVSEL